MPSRSVSRARPAGVRPRRRLTVVAVLVALGAGVLGTASPAAATVTQSLRAVEEDFSATAQRSFSLPAGRQVVTATASLNPADTLAQDWRCTLQTIDAGGAAAPVDEATVRLQAVVAPIPFSSNALPHLTLHGVVTGPVVLRFGCSRVAGSGVVPSVTRLDVVTDRDTSATSATVTASTLTRLPSLATSGPVRAVATVSLAPQDTRSGDLNCRLDARRAGSELVTTLDETVVRVARTAPGTGPSNGLPRFTLAGLGDVGASGTVFVACDPVRTDGYVQPLVPRSRLVVQQGTGGDVRVARDVLVDAGDPLAVVAQGRSDTTRNPKTVVATLTLVPRSTDVMLLSCRLAAFRGLNQTSTLDAELVSVRAAVAPDPLTSNAFPRITLIGTTTLGPQTSIQVRCTPVVAPGFGTVVPRVDRVTMVLLPTGSDGPL